MAEETKFSTGPGGNKVETESLKIESPFNDGTEAPAAPGAAAAPAKKEEKQVDTVEVVVEGEGEKDPEKKKKEREDPIPRKRFDELHDKNKELEKRLKNHEDKLKTLEDDTYKRERESKKRQLVSVDGLEEKEAEKELRLDDLERENKIMKTLITERSGAQPLTLSSVEGDFQAGLSPEDKTVFDTLKDEWRAQMATLKNPEDFKDTSLQKLALEIVAGRNRKKLEAKTDDKNIQISDLTTPGGTRSTHAGEVKKVKLSKDQMAYCNKNNIDPKQYARDMLNNTGVVEMEKSQN